MILILKWLIWCLLKYLKFPLLEMLRTSLLERWTIVSILQTNITIRLIKAINQPYLQFSMYNARKLDTMKKSPTRWIDYTKSLIKLWLHKADELTQDTMKKSPTRWIDYRKSLIKLWLHEVDELIQNSYKNMMVPLYPYDRVRKAEQEWNILKQKFRLSKHSSLHLEYWIERFYLLLQVPYSFHLP